MKRNKFLALLKSMLAKTGSHALAIMVDRNTISLFLHHHLAKYSMFPKIIL